MKKHVALAVVMGALATPSSNQSSSVGLVALRESMRRMHPASIEGPGPAWPPPSQTSPRGIRTEIPQRLSRTRFEHCSVAETPNCNPPVRGCS